MRQKETSLLIPHVRNKILDYIDFIAFKYSTASSYLPYLPYLPIYLQITNLKAD
jgi:hypothetical protein